MGLRALGLAALAATSVEAANVPVEALHYKRVEKHIMVPVHVNGGRTMWFTVDTGARHTVIDAAAARELKLQILSSDSTTGAGKGAVAMQHAADTDVAVGRAKVRVRDPWIIDLNLPQLGKQDGLIGADFFVPYVVRIDPVRETVAFYDAKSFRYDGKGAAVPLAFEDNRMFVGLKLSVVPGKFETHKVRVDSGSDDAVSDNLVRQSPERRKSVQGVGLGQSYIDYSGVFDSVGIGPYTIRHSWGPSNDRPAFGMEILRRFTSTFDVPRGVLYLEPNAHLGDRVPSPEPPKR